MSCHMRVEQIDQRVSALESAAKPTEPPDWDALEKNCLATYMGGHRTDGHGPAFQHGMRTVFNVLRSRYPTPPEWQQRHDQQLERASGLERELGSVREQLRTAEEDMKRWKENWKSCFSECTAAEKRANTNQAAADTLERVTHGGSIMLGDIEHKLHPIDTVKRWKAAADGIAFLRDEWSPHSARSCPACVYEDGKFVRLCKVHEWAESLQAAADTLKQLLQFQSVDIGNGTYRLCDTQTTYTQARIELAQVIAERDQYKTDHETLERLTNEVADLEHTRGWLWAERLEVARLCGYQLDDANEPLKNAVLKVLAEKADLERRLAEWMEHNRQIRDAAGIETPGLSIVESVNALRRNDARWRWYRGDAKWCDAFVDAAIAASKANPKCPKCGHSASQRDNLCWCDDVANCGYRWPKETS